jgi:hypothetical protein
MAARTEKTGVVVTVQDDHLEKMDEVITRLKKEGFEVQHRMDESGFVQGLVNPEKIDSLAKLKGIKRVRPELTFEIAPPDSPVQ